MRKPIYLDRQGQQILRLVDGMTAERLKYERPGEAHGRYLEMLKKKAETV